MHMHTAKTNKKAPGRRDLDIVHFQRKKITGPEVGYTHLWPVQVIQLNADPKTGGIEQETCQQFTQQHTNECAVNEGGQCLRPFRE